MRLCPLLPQEPSGIVPEFNKWIGWATGNWENLVYHFSMSAYKWVYVLVWYPSNSKMYTVDLNKKGVLFAFQEWRWNNFFTNTNPKKSWSIMVVITLMLRKFPVFTISWLSQWPPRLNFWEVLVFNQKNVKVQTFISWSFGWVGFKLFFKGSLLLIYCDTDCFCQSFCCRNNGWTSWLGTPPKTNISPKINGWKMKIPVEMVPFSGNMLIVQIFFQFF